METINYETILKTIYAWPPVHRLRLMQDILRSLTPESVPPRPRPSTLEKVLGLLATGTPPPADAEIEQILAEHRLEKYG